MSLGGYLPTQQLAEFLAAVSSCSDEAAASLVAVERAAEALDAELGAIVRGEEVVAAVGLLDGDGLDAVLREAAGARPSRLTLPQLGDCACLAVDVAGEKGARIVLVRVGDEDFPPEEASLLRAMARVLALTLRLLRGIALERSLREQSERDAAEKQRLAESLGWRQRLLEAASRVHRAISARAELGEVLNEITSGTAELLAAEVVVLRLIDPGDPDQSVIAASHGLDDETLRSTRRAPLSLGAAGRAITTGELAVIEDYGDAEEVIDAYATDGIDAVMAAPVHENGEVIGSLLVGSRIHGHRYSDDDRAVLLAFADHASLALTDAKTQQRMQEAMHDMLTGLPNRALFIERVEQLLAAPGPNPVVLFVDLDRFKLVNDSFGHAYGDQLLVAVGERLRACLAQGETAARLGGDEFAVILSDAPDDGHAIEAAARIVEAVSEPLFIRAHEVRVGASIGIARDGRSAEDLLCNADLAMYRAKKTDDASWMFYQPSMHAAVLGRLELEASLRQAVDRKEFHLQYQPIVSLADGVPHHVESLVRWRKREGGLVLPGTFVPLAEETGLIVPIGRWVLDEACRQAAAWRRSYGSAAPAVTVNLSGVELRRGEVVDDIARAVVRHGLRPSDLTIEITESVFMRDTEENIATLARLRELGVNVAIDDFGTGYSSLLYVQRLPVNMLKIAKPFVDQLCGSETGAAIVRTIVDLGRSLDMMLVAEGIEEAAQADALRALGCEHGQGYHFARPLEAEAMEALIVPVTTRSALVLPSDRSRPQRLALPL
ncbi:MAG TPA: EAL domain-containing protein [Thermoleophilaceae bacterium]|jgi:diguanylate cyclase (GGDEF)-like protein